MDTTRRAMLPRAREKRAQIRTAAQRLFLENGFANTSTDAIIKEAGVSKETLYAYYASKEDLLTDVLQHLVHHLPRDPQPLLNAAAAIGTRDGLRDVLTHFAQEVITDIMQPTYLALLRIIIAESPRVPQLGELFRATIPAQGFRNIAALLQQAHARGVARVPDVDTAARMFIGPMLTYAILDGLFVVDGPPRPPAPERIAAIVALFMETIA